MKPNQCGAPLLSNSRQGDVCVLSEGHTRDHMSATARAKRGVEKREQHRRRSLRLADERANRAAERAAARAWQQRWGWLEEPRVNPQPCNPARDQDLSRTHTTRSIVRLLKTYERCGHAHLRTNDYGVPGGACPRTCVVCGVGELVHQRRHLCARCYELRPSRRNKVANWRQIAERDGWDCWLCWQPVPRPGKWDPDNQDPLYPSVDHMIPLSLGGLDVMDNLRLAHWRCNSLRSNATVGGMWDPAWGTPYPEKKTA